jgi:hypothetical protein
MEKEWHIPDATVPVEQGDILISRSAKTGSIEAIFLVITADCDITHVKFGTHLACLRIVTLQDYLRRVWADRKLRRVVETEVAKVCSLINKWNGRRISKAIPLSSEVVMNWVRNSQPKEICRDLGIPEAEAPKVETTLGIFRSALQALDSKRVSDNLTQLCAFRAAVSGKGTSDCLKDFLQQAQGESLPDDVFLLPNLPQLDIGPAVILLRELTGLPLDMIHFRTVDAISGNVFLRIGRLEPTFKYAVSQAFGTLYSRIGLPETYEMRCKSVIEDIAALNWE